MQIKKISNRKINLKKILELCLHLQIFLPGQAASFSLDNQNWFLSQTDRIGYQILRQLHRALCFNPEAAALGGQPHTHRTHSHR